MPLKIKNITHTLSVNGEYGLPQPQGASIGCGGTDPHPRTCTRPRNFADYLTFVSNEHRKQLEDVINESLVALEAALMEANIAVEGQAYDIVQNLVVNVRSE